MLVACFAFSAQAQNTVSQTITPAQKVDQSASITRIKLALTPDKSIALDLRDYWRSAKKTIAPADHVNSFDPDAVWQWPDGEFVMHPIDQAWRTHAYERTVSRIRLEVKGEPTELIFKVPVARLDAVHLAYRYDNGPWIRAVAGDKIPMLQWPISNYEPVFKILTHEGNIDLIAQVAHQGTWNIPFLVLDSETFYAARMNFSLLMGLLIGVNVVLALVALVAAWTFRRWSFWAVTVMAVAIVLQSAFCSGIAGMYLAKDSAWLNDEAKFFSNFAWCAILPWVTAVALGQRFHARWLWRFAVFFAVAGVLAGSVMATYDWRYSMTVWVPVFFAMCSALSLYMAIDAVRRQQAYAWRTICGVALYIGALAISFSMYFAWMLSSNSVIVSSGMTMLSALVFLHVLAMQHRQGRMVMSRASSSANRDMLTGLYNTQGFGKGLARMVNRLENESTYAVMFYVQLADMNTLRERYGDEGFEISIVQIASSISSVASVNDTVGRVAENAFAVCVMMPRDPEMANRYATQLLTRVMSLSNHLAPVAETARIAIAWIPTFGKTLPELQRRSERALGKLSSSKRIAWVGGAYAQLDAAQIHANSSGVSSQPRTDLGAGQDELAPSLPGVTGVTDVQEALKGEAGIVKTRPTALS